MNLKNQRKCLNAFDTLHFALGELREICEQDGDPIGLKFIGDLDVAILKPVFALRTYLIGRRYLPEL